MAADDKVRMRIKPFVTKTEWQEHKGWHRPAVAIGTTRYAIAYSKGGYFTYSYLAQKDAQAAIDNSIRQGSDTERFYYANVKMDIQETIPVAPKP